jgi:hypothetical protein
MFRTSLSRDDEIVYKKRRTSPKDYVYPKIRTSEPIKMELAKSDLHNSIFTIINADFRSEMGDYRD